MMASKEGTYGPRYSLFRIIAAFVFFVLVYLYVWLRIDPGLINHRQDTLFLLDVSFLNGFLQYPGGLADYASAFLSQFFVYPWLGALIITLLAVNLAILTYTVIKCLCNPRNAFLICLLPVLLTLILHSNYKHTLAANLGLLFALLFCLFHMRMATQKSGLRLTVYLCLAGLLYYLTGGHLLLFTLLCILYEWISKTYSIKLRLIHTLIYLVFTLAVPILSRQFIFMITLKQAYFNTLPFYHDYHPLYIPAVLYLFFPLVMVLCLVPWNRLFDKIAESSVHCFKLSGLHIRSVVQVLLLLVLICLLVFVSFEKDQHTILRMYRYSQSGQWPEIIKLAGQAHKENVRAAFFTNRALYHTGQLSGKMFSYPQKWGKEGLFLPKEYAYRWPMLKSDLFLELAHVNEALHYAYEEISQRGETPRTLRRLALINFLNRDKQTAKHYLSKLEKTIFYKKWAKRFRYYLDRDSLLQMHPELRMVRSLMTDSDFIVVSQDPSMDLEGLLSDKKQNRMAFEYLMASYLLENKIDLFISRIRQLRDLKYAAVPRHYEEALLMYMIVTGKKRIDLPGYRLSQKTVNSYKELEKVLRKYKNNKKEAHDDLSKTHHDSYWFYLMYHKPETTSG